MVFMFIGLDRSKLFKVRLIGAFLILLLILSAVVWQWSAPDSLVEFEHWRQQAQDNQTAALQNRVLEPYQDKISRCSGWSEYESLIARQPADLDGSELVQALELGERCAYYFPDRRDLSVERVAQAVSVMETLVVDVPISTEQSIEFIGLWQSSLDDLKQQVVLFRELSDLQNQYWQAEYDYRSDELISTAERDQRFRDINDRAREVQIELRSSIESLREKGRKEEELWVSWALLE